MRKTEDGYHVDDNEAVYEIMYRYYNKEVSIPEPENRLVRQVPKGVKIWRYENECQKVCDFIAKQERDERDQLHILG